MIQRLDKRHKWSKTIVTNTSLLNICNSCGNIVKNSLVEAIIAVERVNLLSHIFARERSVFMPTNIKIVKTPKLIFDKIVKHYNQH